MTDNLDLEMEDLTALEEQMRSMVAPLREKREILIAKKEKITEQVRGLTQNIDSQVKRIDAMIRASEPSVPNQPKKKRSEESRKVVSESLATEVLEALGKMDGPATSRDVYLAYFEGKYSPTSINNALSALREQERVRLAGFGERKARKYALPLAEAV